MERRLRMERDFEEEEEDGGEVGGERDGVEGQDGVQLEVKKKKEKMEFS